MELNDFVTKFAEQFDETDATEILSNTHFKELDEWSSLTAMSIIAFTKTEYNKEVTGREIRACETVEELYNLIVSK